MKQLPHLYVLSLCKHRRPAKVKDLVDLRKCLLTKAEELQISVLVSHAGHSGEANLPIDVQQIYAFVGEGGRTGRKYSFSHSIVLEHDPWTIAPLLVDTCFTD